MALPQKKVLLKLIETTKPQALSMAHYPSRGQSARQELYTHKTSRIFVKGVSKKNHEYCKIDMSDGTIAEREFWAYRIANHLKLNIPELGLVDKMTTAQEWLDYPDASTHTSRIGALELEAKNIYECGLFDWITGQQDRHNANYLYDLSSKQIILIDSAASFSKNSPSLPDYLEKFELGYSKDLQRKITTSLQQSMQITPQKTWFKLAPLRSAQEREAFLKRLQKINSIQTIGNLIQLFREGV